MSEHDLVARIAAHHEAAHAVVAYRTAGHACAPVSIAPSGDDLGYADDPVRDTLDPGDMEAAILSCYAGGHAQRRIDASRGDAGCEADEDTATEQLRFFGWQSREQELRDRSRELVDGHWVEIEAVARELLRCETLDDPTEIEMIADIAVGGRPGREPITLEDLRLYRALKSGEEIGG